MARLRFGRGGGARDFQGAGLAHDGDDVRLECVPPRRLDRRCGRARAASAVPRCIASDQRQRGLAFAQVVAHVLADLVGVAGVVEHVVDHLERGAQRPAIGGAGFLQLGAASASTAPSRALASNSLAVLERITRR